MKKYLILLLIGLIAAIPAFAAFAASILIKMETNRGDIFLELDQDKAPLSVANFVQYAQEGFYEGTIFHRVISNFMIQGGGYDQDLLRKKPKEPIKNEAANGLKNNKGTIAMARMGDPHSGTAQFYINVQDNPALDHTSKENSRTWGYAVFGKVVRGMDVVNTIKSTPTDARPPFRSDVPIKTMLIKKVTVIDKLPEVKQIKAQEATKEAVKTEAAAQ